jgi:hypothetical protein
MCRRAGLLIALLDAQLSFEDLRPLLIEEIEACKSVGDVENFAIYRKRLAVLLGEVSSTTSPRRSAVGKSCARSTGTRRATTRASRRSSGLTTAAERFCRTEDAQRDGVEDGALV